MTRILVHETHGLNLYPFPHEMHLLLHSDGMVPIAEQGVPVMRSFLSKRSSVHRAAIVVGVSALGIFASVADAKPPRPFPAKNPKPILLSEHGKIVSSPFQGSKANTGTVANTHENGKCVLTLSEDFKVPETPAPHWQIVDSRGNTFLLNRLKIDGGKYNRSIAVPSYINDVAKVQIWCAFAEVNLGEAAFAMPIPNR